MSEAIFLTDEEQVMWEDSGPEGHDFRAAVLERAEDLARASGERIINIECPDYTADQFIFDR